MESPRWPSSATVGQALARTRDTRLDRHRHPGSHDHQYRRPVRQQRPDRPRRLRATTGRIRPYHGDRTHQPAWNRPHPRSPPAWQQAAHCPPAPDQKTRRYNGPPVHGSASITPTTSPPLNGPGRHPPGTAHLLACAPGPTPATRGAVRRQSCWPTVVTCTGCAHKPTPATDLPPSN